MSYQNPSRKHAFRVSTPVRLGVAAVAACFISAPVLSLPVNPAVVNGAASFNQAGKVLTVTNSNGAIINWQKFSIQAGETTHFAQTSASSSVLNRVLNDPTAIYGTLSSNGRVWLVNPAGIMVGPGGRVDVAGFVASTLNIRNQDFLAGRSVFINDGSAQNVVNQGEIRTPAGGSVYLIGSNVSNEGIITTPKGETILAAGATVSLIDSATPGVKVDITGSEGNATNLGTLTAEAGRIGIAGVIVRNSGTINASSVVSEGGRVFLKASQDAYVDGNGRIVTTGTKGGSVEVLGNRVAVMGNAEIDASGTNGGGKIMVGGDYQGKNPDVQNANVSYFGPNATLKADATEVGDGGTVIVWADDTTRAYGNISARGGAAGGNGGFVETSGKRYLSVDGIRVDTRAPQGKTGTWLLDPSDITIYGGSGGTTAVPATVNSNPIGILTTEFTTGSAYGSSIIYANTINTALVTTDVIIHTAGGTGGNGNISVYGATITPASGPGWALTLAAAGAGVPDSGNIYIENSTISVRDGVTLLAGWNGTMPPYGADGNTLSSADVMGGTGSITILGSTIQSSEWAVNLWAGKDITLKNLGTRGTLIQGAAMDIQAGNNLTLESTFVGTISSSQGPGVVLHNTATDGPQTIKAGNQILLQAGSADNTVYGGGMSGAGVGIFSDAGAGYGQTISANIIKVYAGAGGHDNAAVIQSYGSQTINITGVNGLLEVKGGGSADSYNNEARIQHGQNVGYGGYSYNGTGDQTITFAGYGGTINVAAGSGTGVLGYYGADCASVLGEAACRGSSNGAEIENGIGLQTLTFVYGGNSLTVTGGSAGTQNWAGIQNKGDSQAIYGSPNITLTGGSAGGSAVSYGDEIFEFSNDAGIFSKGSGGQYITAGTLTLYGGGADVGGAGISNEGALQPSLQIVTTGDLSMYGGSSSGVHPYGGAVYIHSEYGGPITLDVGGNLYVKGGSGTSAPAIIGSVDGPVDIKITTASGRNINFVADGSGVAIGSLSDSYGATINISSGGSLTTSGSTKGVMIGSAYGGYSSPTTVTLNARSDINLGSSTLVGVMYPEENWATAEIRLVAGWYGADAVSSVANTSAGYGSIVAGSAGFLTGGGSFTALASDNIALGSVNTDAPLESGFSAGNVTATANNGTLSVASISAKGADAGYYGDTGGKGGNVTLSAYGGLTLGTGGINASGGRGGDGGEGWSAGQGGMGGTVTLTSQTGTIAVNGDILAKGGQGGAGESGYHDYYSGAYSGYQGGQGGEGGTILLSANATGSVIQLGGIRLDVSGGKGGSGGVGGSGYGYYGFSNAPGGSGGQGGVGGTINLSAAGSSGGINLGSAQLDSSGGMGGAGGQGGSGGGDGYSGYSGAQGGQGGQGGTIILSAPGSGGSINLASAQLHASGGVGGTGGFGGDDNQYTYSAFGSSGGVGGMGGRGGTVNVNATGLAGSILVGTAQVRADGGTGGQGGQGGYAYSTYNDAWGGNGGQGGTGGSGGVLLSLTSGSGGTSMSAGGLLAARGGQGGAGGIGGAAVADASGYSGYGGSLGGGGDGGNSSGTAGRISLTSYGDIAFSGLLDTRGGLSGAGGAYTGSTGPGGSVVIVAGWNGGYMTTNGTTGSITAASGSITTGGGSFTAYAGSSITLGSVNTDGTLGYSGGNVNMRADYGSLSITSISAKGGAGGQGYFGAYSGGAGGNVTLQSYGGLTLGTGGSINASGGTGGAGWDGAEGRSATSGGEGGGGGQVTLTSLTGNVAVNGNITVDGGVGGKGGRGRDNAGDGGWISGQGGSQGGSGGIGGSIRLNAMAGSVVLAGGVSLSATGGIGGMGGTGGNGTGFGGQSYTFLGYDGYGAPMFGYVPFAGYGQGGGGGGGGNGGSGGILALQGGSIVVNSLGSLAANGGIGGQGGVGGNGSGASYGGATGSAQGGSGGWGGGGGSGGVVSLAGGNGGISIVSATLAARGGQGGAGNAGGTASVAGGGYSSSGSAGGGGSGGNDSYSAGAISLTSYGDIAFSGLLDTRGGLSGAGAYSGNTGAGGSVVMVAGWTGYSTATNGTTGSITAGSGSITTGGGSFAAYAGNSIALGSVNTDGVMGYKGGDVNMRADYGSLAITSISAKGGDGFWGSDGNSGGNVTLQSYGGLTLGTGGINATGGKGGDGGEGGPGPGPVLFAYSSGGGSGGSGGQVTLTSLTGNIAVNGPITANGGNGGKTFGYGNGYNGYGYNNGGSAGNINLTANVGSITLTNARLSANGGSGGNSESGYSGYGSSGGTVVLSSYGGITLTSGSSISAKGGDGGNVTYGGYAGYAGGGGSIILTNNGTGNISLTGSPLNANGGLGGSTGAYSDYSGYGAGGAGGTIVLTNSGAGNISLSGNSSLSANGGDGGSAGVGYAGYAGGGGTIALNSYGGITLSGSPISANGGTGGTANGFSGYGGTGYGIAGYAGGGGSIVLTNNGTGSISLTSSSISANGGIGGSAGYGYAGYAGSGGYISLTTGGSISLTGSPLAARGGPSGFGWPGYRSKGTDTTNGGNGGSINLNSNILGGITLSGTTLDVQGGAGGPGIDWGYVGGEGGSGGVVNLQTVNGSIALNSGSNIYAGGGVGGKGANDFIDDVSVPSAFNSASTGGLGGQGGNVMVQANGGASGIDMSGSAVTAAGGDGGAGGNAGAYAGYGGDGGLGGSGGTVSLVAGRAIQSATVYVNGGAAGTAGTGFGGYGGGFVGNLGGGGGVVMTSFYGGSAGSLAISAAVVGADSLTATVTGGVYGGINVGHTGLQPTTLVIDDSATSQGSINFFNSGDLNLNGGQTFATSSTGSTQIGSSGILSVTGSVSGYDINLGGATIDVNGGGVFASNNIQMSAGTIDVRYGGYVSAGNNAALITPLVGGTINLAYGGGVYAGANGTPSSITGGNGVTLPYKGIAFLAQNLNGDYGGFLNAGGFYGGISGLLSGDLTGKNGAYFSAGDDIEVAFAGSDSTISLSGGAYFLADYATAIPATIYLDFLTRTSGGVMIDGAASTTSSPGGSGFFVVDHGTPATIAGQTLVISYAGNATTVDPCVSSPDICKPPLPIDIPVVDPCATAPDSAQCEAYIADKDKEKEKPEKDNFGDEDRNENSSKKKVATCGV